MLAAGWSPGELFYAASVPMLLGAAAIAAMGLIYSRAAPAIGAEELLPP
jgi:hypothetical protein